MKPSWTSEIYQKVQLKNDIFQAFDTKRDDVISAVTDRPTDSILESLYKMQVEKSEELNEVRVASVRSRNDNLATRNTTMCF